LGRHLASPSRSVYRMRRVSLRRDAYCSGQRCSLLLHNKGKVMMTREEILSQVITCY
jgi:hypothetical protein